jgi:ribosome-associated protein
MDKNFYPEFEFICSRSSGAGGQNVNKVSTKVELRFNVFASQILSEDEKKLLFLNLRNKMNKEGILQIISQEERSQLQNRENCVKKFYLLINKSLTVQKERTATKPTFASRIRRLDGKKHHALKKKERSANFDDRSFFISAYFARAFAIALG